MKQERQGDSKIIIIIRFQYINQRRGPLIDDNYFAVALPPLFHSFFRLDFSLSIYPSIYLSIYRSPSFSLTLSLILCVTHLLSLSSVYF